MIQYVMLVLLGFFAASLLFVLVAPSFWARAVRLTKMRMEMTMPLSLSEIEAGKDQLRAQYAVKLRRLEASLTKAKEKAAHQLVEMSRMQMSMAELTDQVAALERSLEERRNAAEVFEQTIRQRFPELEEGLAGSQSALEEKVQEIASLQSIVRRREEALAETQRTAGQRESEVARLREAIAKGAAEGTGRFKKKTSDWGLEEYRSEYDRLNGELSKLRDQLAAAADREAHQIGSLKTELQQLGEQIMNAATAAAVAPVPAHAPAPAPAAQPAAPRESEPPAAVPAPRPAIIRRPVTAKRTPAAWPKPEAEEAEPVEAEPLDKGRTVRPFDTRRPSRFSSMRMEDFSNKSLEEVLEAALPMSSERVGIKVSAVEDHAPVRTELLKGVLPQKPPAKEEPPAQAADAPRLISPSDLPVPPSGTNAGNPAGTPDAPAAVPLAEVQAAYQSSAAGGETDRGAETARTAEAADARTNTAAPGGSNGARQGEASGAADDENDELKKGARTLMSRLMSMPENTGS